MPGNRANIEQPIQNAAGKLHPHDASIPSCGNYRFLTGTVHTDRRQVCYSSCVEL